MWNAMKVEDSNLQPWDDQVFENRNKEYGAYQIRKAYVKHVTRGVIITMMVLLIALFFPRIIKLFSSNAELGDGFKTMSYRDLGPPPAIDKIKPLSKWN